MADDELAACLSAWHAVADGMNGLATERTPICTAVPRLVAAVEAVLEEHAQTRHTVYTEPCTAHLSSVLGRRNCPDCRPVERTGCRKCRDENDLPARPEDCAERNMILRALTGEEAGSGG